MSNKELSSPEAYIAGLPDERKLVISKMREVVLHHLPRGFEEVISYGMLGYVVPHSLYPKGYHCDSKLPLPFINLASQKHFVGFYHMGVYSQPKLLSWFQKEYPKQTQQKLDMGKSCVRFKKLDDIPYALIGALCEKITPEEWIGFYEKNISKNQRK